MFFRLLFLCAVNLSISQTNTWQKITDNQIGNWGWPGLTYSQITHEFVVTMGTLSEDGTNDRYSVQVFTSGLGKWINALPNPALYGVWADSTGYARGNGRVGNGVFGTYYWAFKEINYNGAAYLRPNLGAHHEVRAYGQFALNTDDGKIYFYINNVTFTYDPATRLWDTLSTAVHPNTGAAEGALKWGSLCYDALNKEIVLFGGGAIDNPKGTPETWTFKPATNTWTKLALDTQPSGRANSPMAYDAAAHKIVLFGGDALDSWLNDTWVYDCATKTWAKRNPALRPTPRAGHALLFLPKSGKILLLGGYSAVLNPASSCEMWKYDVAGDNWALVKRFEGSQIWPKYASAVPAMCGVAAVDANDTILALADTVPSGYYFTPSTYRIACDPAVTDVNDGATYGLARDTIALRGDWTEPSWFTAGVALPDTGINEAFLRGLTVGTWAALTVPKQSPDNYAWSTTILDTDRDQFLKWGGGHVAHCGTDVPHYSIADNRWTLGYRPEWPLEWNGGNNPCPGPFTFNGRPFVPTHCVKAYAYDVNLRKMVYTAYAHTWIYNPDLMDWDKVDIHNPAGFSSGYGAGLISTPHGIFCLSNGYAWTFSSDSLRWRKLPLTGSLPGYYADQGGLVYDSKRDRVIIAEGQYNTLGKMWTYDYATATGTQIFPADSSLATGNEHYRECAYLPNQDVVVFQIIQGSSLLAYDCAENTWKTAPFTNIPATVDDRGGSLMYDGKRNLLWSCDYRSGTFVVRPDNFFSPDETPVANAAQDTVSMAPNPFNPSVSLMVTLSAKSAVSAHVGIYTASGQRVREWKASDFSTGRNRLVWDGCSAEGKRMAAGLYVLKLNASGKQHIRKLVLAR